MDIKQQTSVKVYSTIPKTELEDFEKVAKSEGHSVASKVRYLMREFIKSKKSAGNTQAA